MVLAWAVGRPLSLALSRDSQMAVGAAGSPLPRSYGGLNGDQPPLPPFSCLWQQRASFMAPEGPTSAVAGARDAHWHPGHLIKAAGFDIAGAGDSTFYWSVTLFEATGLPSV